MRAALPRVFSKSKEVLGGYVLLLVMQTTLPLKNNTLLDFRERRRLLDKGCISFYRDCTTMIDERGLIERAQHGQADALDALLQLHQDRVYRTAQRMALSDAEAQDISQEALLKIARSIRGFQFRSQFSTWIYQVTINVARDYARSMRRIQEAKREVAAQLHIAESDGEAAARSRMVRAALQKLSEKERMAVTLHYFEGLAHAEIATAMECAETTVSWYIFMARKKLKPLLSGGIHG